MKNKTTLINITLGAILVCSLASNIILFNRVSSTNETLQTSKLDVQKENVKLLALKETKLKIATDQSVVLGKTEDGNDYGEGWTGVKTEQVPSDPSKKLRGGITLWEAKLQIDTVIKSFSGKGYSADKIADLEKQLAIDLGTTIEEVKRLPAQSTAKVEKPVQGKENTPSAGTNKPSTGGSNVGSGSTGDYDHELDNYRSSGGGTVEVPDDEIGISDGN